MVNFLDDEFNKDDRDYKRFFQSRNVSLSHFAKKIGWDEENRQSGPKLDIVKDSFFPLIAKKMMQKI